MVIQAMSGFVTALRPGGIPPKSGISTADTMGAEMDWPMLSSPLLLQLTPPQVTHVAPDVNQDGEAILNELGLTTGETATLA